MDEPCKACGYPPEAGHHPDCTDEKFWREFDAIPMRDLISEEALSKPPDGDGWHWVDAYCTHCLEPDVAPAFMVRKGDNGDLVSMACRRCLDLTIETDIPSIESIPPPVVSDLPEPNADFFAPPIWEMALCVKCNKKGLAPRSEIHRTPNNDAVFSTSCVNCLAVNLFDPSPF